LRNKLCFEQKQK